MGGFAGIDPMEREEEQRCTECGKIISTLYETCYACHLEVFFNELVEEKEE